MLIRGLLKSSRSLLRTTAKICTRSIFLFGIKASITSANLTLILGPDGSQCCPEHFPKLNKTTFLHLSQLTALTVQCGLIIVSVKQKKTPGLGASAR